MGRVHFDCCFSCICRADNHNLYKEMIVGVSLVLLVLFQLASCRPASEQEGAMADAIKYLADLDSFYSEQVRPRPFETIKKSVGDLSLIGSSLSNRARPRFGKRADEAVALRNLEHLMMLKNYYSNQK